MQLATNRRSSRGRRRLGAEPNTHTDPVCLGLPGALPVLNRAVVDAAVRLGLAVGSKIRQRCRFTRKHYFYPDLPKNIQISQFDEPICEGGTVKFRLNGEARGAPDPHPPGRGRGQEHPRRRARAWSTTTARAFRCARSSASPTPFRRGGGGVRARNPHAGALPRHRRRQHGGRLAPLRRACRCARAARRRSAPRPRSRT